MTNKEAIEILKVAIAEVEWECPMDYTIAFEMAIEALENQSRLSEHIRIIDEEKLLHHMWEALWKCEDETEEQEGFDAFNRFYIQKGFEAGLQAVIQEPIAYNIEPLEKQTPKKTILYRCSNCDNLAGYDADGNKPRYCYECGYRLDWGDEI